MKAIFFSVLLLPLVLFSACDDGTEADERGVGSECQTVEDCTEEGQECLAFRGGYCGIKDCTGDEDCPEGSKCVSHTDSVNYCFRVCTDKPECNLNRSEENESNCSSNIVFVDTQEATVRACVPPSSDTTL